MKNIIFVFIFLIQTILYGVNNLTSEVDSLKNLLNQSSGEKKVDLLNQLTYIYKDISPQTALEYGNEGLKLAKALKYIKGEAYLKNSIGFNYLVISDYSNAAKFLLEAYELSKSIGDKNLLAGCYNNLGLFYYFLNNADKSIYNFLKAIEIRKEINDKKGLANSINNIGMVYIKIKDYPLAIKYFNESHLIKKEMADKPGIVRTLCNLAVINIETNNLDEADRLIGIASKLSIETDYMGGFALCNSYLGRIEFLRKNYQKSIIYFDESNDYYSTTGSTAGIIENLIYKSSVLHAEKKDKLAIESLDKAVELSKSINTEFFLQEIYKTYSEIYYDLGDLKKAHTYKDKWLIAKDSTFNLEKSRYILQLQMTQETEQKQKEIESKEKIIDAQRKVLTVSLFAVLVSIIFLIFISRIYRKNKNLLKEKEEANLLLESAFEQTKIPLVLVEYPSNRFKIINTACREFFEIADEESLIGKEVISMRKTWKDFDENGNEMSIADLPISLALRGEKIDGKEMSVLTKNGNKKYELVSSSPIFNSEGKQIAAFIVFPEITELKRLNDQLSLYANELQESNKTKDILLSIISHDLRGPFHGFLGYSNILANEVEHLSVSEIKKFAVTLNKSLIQQYKFLEDLLKWSQLQINQINFVPQILDLNTQIDLVLENMSQVARNKEIKIIKQIPKDLSILADKDLLDLVLRNLISNAIKFSQKNSKIEIWGSLNGNNTDFSIIDSGIGMSEEVIDRVSNVNNFYTSTGTNNEEGTGLGLMLCREVIKKHNGKLSIKSEIGVGTNFSVSFPNFI